MRKFKLGMHTYALHLWGFGSRWHCEEYKKVISLVELMDKVVEWGVEGLHISACDLETTDDARLEEIGAAAKERNLYLEYNFSRDDHSDKRINDTVEHAAYVAHKLGAKVAKYAMDILRERPLYGSCMQPTVMRQLADQYDIIKAALPTYEKYGITLAVENHCDTYADEVLWLVNALDTPLVGTCVDTVNSFCVLEGPEAAVEKLAPQAVCCHFSDNKIVGHAAGPMFEGAAVGEGDIDCKKVIQLLRKVSPRLDRVNFEIEWEIGNDTLDVARAKQMDACVRSVRYCRDVLKIGREDELLG